MENVGIEFTMQDGSKENFDPLNYENDFEERETDYYFQLSNGHFYSVVKEDVNNYRLYNLCEKCGYEITTEGCSKLSCFLFKKRI